MPISRRMCDTLISMVLAGYTSVVTKLSLAATADARRGPRLATALGIGLALAAAVPVRAATFDYYLLSLSWSPEYCAASAHVREPQCTRPYAFVVHGLWPQYERGGYPHPCSSGTRVDEATLRRLLPIMPSRGLIVHEWRQHGRCTGLPPDRYFAQIERAYQTLHIPPRYRALDRPLTIDPVQLKRDFVHDNPGLPQAGIVVQCQGQDLQEVRICLDTDLVPRACGRDVRDRCGRRVVLPPVR